ncbi:MAG: hypothetical protein REH83_00820 [Rickettsiella sp.]|nr:hypothetical protein [Rickettsiella sp.]
MIIETITAFVAIKITWETLEILHLLHVGHSAGMTGYDKGSCFIKSVQQRLQNIQDAKSPAQKLEREAQTLYNYQAPDTMTLKQIRTEAQDYLTLLKGNIENLRKAQKNFEKIHSSLTELLTALSSNNDETFRFYLIKLESNLISFKIEVNNFLTSLTSPPRQSLYIADSKDGKIIEKYNIYVQSIKESILLLQKTEKLIAEKFKKSSENIDAWLIEEGLHFSDICPETLPQQIDKCLKKPQQIMEKVSQFIPKDKKLAIACASIIEIFSKLHEIPKNAQSIEDHPAWQPLLKPEEQIEVGQRIFLHAMNADENSEQKKLWFAQIFLRKPIPHYEVEQEEIEKLAYEMAQILRNWQIEKCGQLIQFLSTLKEGVGLPQNDPDRLLEWIKNDRRKHNSVTLFKEILVTPCCLSECSLESALMKLKRLSISESSMTLLQKHWGSNWGSIWKKNDRLIQLPKSFETKILPESRAKKDESGHTSYIVSSAMHELAIALIKELRRLEIQLFHNKYFEEMSVHEQKQKQAAEQHNKQAHEQSVMRVKKAQLHTNVITSKVSNLYPYVDKGKTINQEEKKQQVATVDDLIQLIYLGLDPNGSCKWKHNSANDSIVNKLAYYFMPREFKSKAAQRSPTQDQQKKDSRISAWIYACTECQINVIPTFAYLFSTLNRPLATINTPELLDVSLSIQNMLSVKAILENPNKKITITHCKALSGVSPEKVAETEKVVQELQDYYLSALVRVKPEYLAKLPFKKQVECVVKNFFKFGTETGEERLESVQIFLGNLCTILSEENNVAINNAITELKKSYDARLLIAKAKHKAHRSKLYTIMKETMDTIVVAIIEQLQHMGDFELKQQNDPDEEGSTKPIIAEGVLLKITEAQAREKAALDAIEIERREKEAALNAIELERKEKEVAQETIEKERKEKEAAQAEIERLKLLLATSKIQTSPPSTLAGSRVTLFKIADEPSTSTTGPDLPEYNYAP